MDMPVEQTTEIKQDILENRELSWLSFNERVLAEAEDSRVPLMERVRFAEIFDSNLDEFLMVRTGTLINRRLGDDGMRDPRTAMRPSEQLERIYAETARLCGKRDAVISRLETELAEQGLIRRSLGELTKEQSKFLDEYYATRIKPGLSVIYSAAGQLPPFIAGGKCFAAYRLAGGSAGAAFVCCGTVEGVSLIRLPSDSGTEYIAAEEVILSRAGELCISEGGSVTESTVIRLLRSADILREGLPEGDLPPLDAMKQALNLRDALPAVCMQTAGRVSELFAAELCSLFSVSREQVFQMSLPLCRGRAAELCKMAEGRSGLFYPPFAPAERACGGRSVIDEILDGDVLLAYPYEGFGYFLRFLEEAAEDVRVASVKMTIYRTAPGSKVIAALCRAAENGKAVTVCVELRARFDERHNIACAEKLTAAGCRVIYGLKGFKVHSKLCLVTMNDGGEMLRITQVGTGNYNEVTAEHYTDLSLFTADTDISSDAARVFESLERGELPGTAYTLMVSPKSLKDRIISLIDEEIAAADSGAAAYLGAKLNGLTDTDIIAKLSEASSHGVRTELLVRGICCLRPGVSGATDNIRIVSVVGRFLEHARVYIFGSGPRQRVFISSADLMTRNTMRRVEAAAPIKDPAIKERIVSCFAIQMNDRAEGFVKHPDGSYSRAAADGTPGSQRRFMEEFAPPAAVQEEREQLPETSYEEKKPPSAELPPALPPEPKKGFFARIASFFSRLGRRGKQL